MWTPEEVEQMKRSSAFEKEYNLKFGYGTSTIFNVHDIDFITSDSYDTSDETCTSPYFTKWLAIDPGWGGSNSFGIAVLSRAGLDESTSISSRAFELCFQNGREKRIIRLLLCLKRWRA